MRSMYWLALLITLFTLWGYWEAQYRSMLKYYPEMSRSEYILLYDKLRVTNEHS